MLDDTETLFAFRIDSVKNLSLKVEGVGDIVLALVVMAHARPRFLRKVLDIARLGKDDWLHHLAKHSVGQDHDRNPILVSNVECAVDVVSHLLDRGRCVHDQAEVTMSHGAGRLPIVGLGRLDGAKAWAATLNVDNDSRKVRARHIGDALGLQADSGA